MAVGIGGVRGGRQGSDRRTDICDDMIGIGGRTLVERMRWRLSEA